MVLGPDEAREAVRDYLTGAEQDLRAGRLPEMDDRYVRETAAAILENHEATPEIMAYVIDLLRTGRSVRPARSGPRTPLRDLQIVLAVWVAMQKGLPRTRNRNPRPDREAAPSASSIVAEELRRLGIKGVSEASVEQIWDRFKRRAAPGFLPGR